MNQTPVWIPPQRRGFWSRLSPVQRVGLIGAALILPCCGGLTVVGALTGAQKPTATETTSAEQLAGEPAAAQEPTTATTTAATTAAATTGTTTVITTKNVTVTKEIGFSTRTVEDDDLDEGTTKVRAKGVKGVRTLTYQVTVVGGKETGRKLVSDVVTRKPVTKVVAVGTKTAGDECDPNYDPCVPIASDVDCAGGSGNGPAFVDGPIRVIGDDRYDLDRDGDRIACD